MWMTHSHHTLGSESKIVRYIQAEMPLQRCYAQMVILKFYHRYISFKLFRSPGCDEWRNVSCLIVFNSKYYKYSCLHLITLRQRWMEKSFLFDCVCKYCKYWDQTERCQTASPLQGWDWYLFSKLPLLIMIVLMMMMVMMMVMMVMMPDHSAGQQTQDSRLIFF